MMVLRFILLAGTLSALHPTGTLRGTVSAVGSLEPIPVATVRVVELDRSVLSDERGFYTLADLPPGRLTVEATAYGFRSTSITIRSTGTGAIRLDFELRPQPVRLHGVSGRGASSPRQLIPDVEPSRVGPPSVRLSGPALKLVPGVAEPDVLRSLQLLPSVAAMSDFSSALYVRGGSADQTLITLDGIPVFNPYHMAGLFSAFSSDVVRSVEIWPGAMPSGAGDRLSATVAVETRAGARDSARASGGVGLISANVAVDGPLPGRKGSYLLSGRHTYLDVISAAAYGTGLLDVSIPYGFSDAYLKLTHDVGAAGSLSLSAYLNGEAVEVPERMRAQGAMNAQFDWGSRMLAAKYRQPFGRSFLLEARAGFTDFTGTFDAWEYRRSCFANGGCRPEDTALDTVRMVEGHSLARDLLAGADLTWYGRRHTIRMGAQVDAYAFDQGVTLIEDAADLIPAFGTSDDPRTVAGYLEDEWRATDRLELRAGLRVLRAGDDGTELLPRFGATLNLAPGLSLSLGGGRYAQAIRSMKDDASVAASFVAYDILSGQPAGTGLATAEDVALGLSWESDGTRVRVDAYERWLHGLILAPISKEPTTAPPLVTDSFRVGEGRARGVEVLLSRRIGAADLTLSYALSMAKRSADRESWTPRFERRHLVDMAASIPWGAAGLISARLAVGTGQPFTPIVGMTEVFRHSGEGMWTPYDKRVVFGPHNSDRLPGYLRLDAGVRREFGTRWFGHEGTLTPYFQVVNLLNTPNVLIGLPTISAEFGYLPQIPILPTFGVEWRF